MALNVLEATQAALAELSAEPGDASPAPESVSETPESGASAAAPTTEKPATPATEEPALAAVAEKRGPIPFDRHEAILRKQREEAETSLKRFEGIDPDAWRERLAAFEAAERDPWAFHQAFEKMLRADPRFATRFAAAVGAADPKADPMPEADLELEGGLTAYSAQRMAQLLDWRDRQSQQKQTAAEAAVTQRRAEAWQSAATSLDDARRNWEGFTENEGEIANILASDGRATLESAYRRVVVPKLKADKARIEQETRDRLITEMQQKPRANTEVPSGGAGGAAKNFAKMSIYDVVSETAKELSSRS